jgi:hypothetical protein
MSTITVENTNYEFQEIPGKGKCLVPVKKEQRIRAGDLYRSGNYLYMVTCNDTTERKGSKYNIVYIKTLEGKPIGSIGCTCFSSFNVNKEDLLKLLTVYTPYTEPVTLNEVQTS